MDRKIVKQFGMKRSGTNYTALALHLHTSAKVLSNGAGWKHEKYRVPQVYGSELDCIVTTKHPLAWLCSMYRWEGCRKPFKHYLKVQRREMIELWGLMHNNWLSASQHMKKKKIIFVKYEDFLRDGSKMIDRIVKEFDLKRISKWKNIRGCMNTKGRETGKEFNRRNYYLDRQYMKEYTRQMIDHVRAHLDMDMVKKMGYKF